MIAVIYTSRARTVSEEREIPDDSQTLERAVLDRLHCCVLIYLSGVSLAIIGEQGIAGGCPVFLKCLSARRAAGRCSTLSGRTLLLRDRRNVIAI